MSEKQYDKNAYDKMFSELLLTDKEESRRLSLIKYYIMLLIIL